MINIVAVLFTFAPSSPRRASTEPRDAGIAALRQLADASQRLMDDDDAPGAQPGDRYGGCAAAIRRADRERLGHNSLTRGVARQRRGEGQLQDQPLCSWL
jgi:hypothetical protein